MELKLAFIGFGGVARAFARLLANRSQHLQDRYGLTWKATAIATAHHGCISSSSSIDLGEALERMDRDSTLLGIGNSTAADDTEQLIDTCEADVFLETTPLNAETGEPAAGYLRRAMERGVNVITANKGPIAFAYNELRGLAAKKGVQFRFEGTVMDGAPVFNMVESCLPGDRVLEFRGVLNSTTNYILTRMESGEPFQACLNRARKLGIAEANAAYDLDGHDAAMKAVALANVLMGAAVHPRDVRRAGIRDISPADLQSAARGGEAIRLIARARVADVRVAVSVSPERVPLCSPLGSLRGTSNALSIKLELMGELTLIETNPGIEQTAYALLSDMIRIHEHTAGRRD